nr:LamG-like jellyroll fold domain-containing protein [Candidatus Sigynarchaeota archaeon]
MQDINSFEGIAVDLLIPDIFSQYWKATTFENITIVFVDSDVHEFTWTLTKETLFSYLSTDLHPESQSITLDSVRLKRIRIPIPFTALNFVGPDRFDPEKITTVNIQGKNLDVYPGAFEEGIGIVVPANDLDWVTAVEPQQYLGITGIYFVDLINDVSIWSSPGDFTGTPEQQSVGFTVASIGTASSTTASLQIDPVTAAIELSSGTVLNTLEFSDYMYFDGITITASLDGQQVSIVDEKPSILGIDTISLQGLRSGNWAMLGLPAVYGLADSLTFSASIAPEIFDGLSIAYSGSPFFTAARDFLITGTGSFKIVKEKLVFDTEIGASINNDFVIDQNGLDTYYSFDSVPIQHNKYLQMRKLVLGGSTSACYEFPAPTTIASGTTISYDLRFGDVIMAGKGMECNILDTHGRKIASLVFEVLSTVTKEARIDIRYIETVSGANVYRVQTIGTFEYDEWTSLRIRFLSEDYFQVEINGQYNPATFPTYESKILPVWQYDHPITTMQFILTGAGGDSVMKGHLDDIKSSWDGIVQDFESYTIGYDPRQPGSPWQYSDANALRIFLESAPVKIQDGSGNVVVIPRFTSGAFGKALYFDGNMLVSTDSVDRSSSFSLCAYVKPFILPSSGSSVVPLFDARDTIGGVIQAGTSISMSSNRIVITYHDGSIAHAYAFSALRWYLISVVFDATAGTITTYVDGKFVDQTTGISFATTGQNYAPFILGKDEAANKYFYGLMDEILIYDRALLQNQVRALSRVENRIDVVQGEAAYVVGMLRDDDNHYMWNLPTNNFISSTFTLSQMRYNAASGTSSWVSGIAMPAEVPQTSIQVVNEATTPVEIVSECIGMTFIAERSGIDSISIMTTDDDTDVADDPESVNIEVIEMEGDVPVSTDTVIWSTSITYQDFTGGRVGTFGWYDISLDESLIPGAQYCITFTSSSFGAANDFMLHVAATTGNVFEEGMAIEKSEDDALGFVEKRMNSGTETTSCDLVFRTSFASHWDKCTTGIVQIENVAGTWVDWKVFQIGYDGTFSFLIDTKETADTYLDPGMYNAKLVYSPLHLGGSSSLFYEDATMPFTITVFGAKTEIQYLLEDQAVESSVPVQSRTVSNTLFTDGAGEFYTRIVANRTYSDPAHFDFKLVSRNQPLGNRPLWMQIGVSPGSVLPRSIDWVDDPGANAELDYLRLTYGEKYIRDLFGIQTIEQKKLANPVFYPFMRDSDTKAYWGPSVWIMDTTDPTTGIATFNFPNGIPVKDVMTMIDELGLFGSPQTIEDINFYIKVIYDSQFSWLDKELNEPVDQFGTSYVPTDPEFASTGNRLWFVDDGTRGPGYYDPLYADTVAEGVLYVQRESVLITGGARTVIPREMLEAHVISHPGMDPITKYGFPVQLTLLEADVDSNGAIVPETTSSGSGMKSDFKIPENAEAVYMELWNDDKTQVIINSSTLWDLTSWPGETNADGSVEIIVDPALSGLSFLMPGTYQAKTWTDGSEYLKPAQEHTFSIDILSENAFNMSVPSFRYSFMDILRDSGVALRESELLPVLDIMNGVEPWDGSTAYDIPSWETNYPVLVGMVGIRNTTEIVYPEELNMTEEEILDSRGTFIDTMDFSTFQAGEQVRDKDGWNVWQQNSDYDFTCTVTGENKWGHLVKSSGSDAAEMYYNYPSITPWFSYEISYSFVYEGDDGQISITPSKVAGGGWPLMQLFTNGAFRTTNGAYDNRLLFNPVIGREYKVTVVILSDKLYDVRVKDMLSGTETIYSNGGAHYATNPYGSSVYNCTQFKIETMPATTADISIGSIITTCMAPEVVAEANGEVLAEDLAKESIPTSDGTEVNILLNGVVQRSLNFFIEENASDWKDFEIPLDQYVNYHWDSALSSWVYGKKQVKNPSTGQLEWVDDPLDISFEFRDIADYANKEIYLAQLKIVDSYIRQDLDQWMFLNEFPSDVPLTTGTYNYDETVNGSFVLDLIDPGQMVTLAVLDTEITNEGGSDAVRREVVKTPKWRPSQSYSGVMVVDEDGEAVFGVDPATGCPWTTDDPSTRVAFAGVKYVSIDSFVVTHDNQDLTDTRPDIFPYNTTITFKNVFKGTSNHPVGVTQRRYYSETNGVKESVYEGWQFGNSPWQDGARLGSITLGSGSSETTYESIVMQTRPDNSATTSTDETDGLAVVFPSLYLPYRAFFSGSIYVAAPGDGFLWAEVIVRSTIDPSMKFKWILPISSSSNYHEIVPLSIDILHGGGDWHTAPGMTFFGPDGKSPADLEGTNVDIILQVRHVVGGGERGTSMTRARVHWINPEVTGWENIVFVSTGLDDQLMGKIYGTSFTSLYCNDVIGNMGLSRYDGYQVAPYMNDLKFAIDGPITSVLNIMNHNRVEGDPFDPANPATNWNQILAAFNEYPTQGSNTETMYEILTADPNGDGIFDDKNGDGVGNEEDDKLVRNAFVRLKFKESIRSSTEPSIVKGVFKVFQQESTGLGTSRFVEKAAFERRITAIIQPWYYKQYSNYRSLSQATDAIGNTVHKTFTSPLTLNTNVGTDKDLVDSILASYRKAIGPRDLVISDWNEVVKAYDPGSAHDPATEAGENHLRTSHNLKPVEFDEYLFRSIYNITEWQTQTLKPYTVLNDPVEKSGILLLLHSSGASNTEKIGGEWLTTDQPFAQVINTTNPVINGIRVWPQNSSNPETLEKVRVSLYPNKRVMLPRTTAQDVSEPRKYEIIPDFSQDFNADPAIIQPWLEQVDYTRDEWMKGYLPFSYDPGISWAGWQDTGIFSPQVIRINIHTGDFWCNFPELQWRVATGCFFIIGSGDITEPAEERFAVWISYFEGINPPEAITTKYGVPSNHIITVTRVVPLATSYPSASELADCIYEAMTSNLHFMAGGNIQVTRLGTSGLEFKWDESCSRKQLIPCEVLGNYYPWLDIISSEGGITTTPADVKKIGAGDGIIDDRDGFYGYTLVFEGYAGTYSDRITARRNITLSWSDNALAIVSGHFLNISDGNGGIETFFNEGSFEDAVFASKSILTRSMSYRLGTTQESQLVATMKLNSTIAQWIWPTAAGKGFDPDWTKYKVFGYQLLASGNVSNIDHVTVKLKDTSGAYIETCSFTDRFDSGSSILFAWHSLVIPSATELGYIEFSIAWKLPQELNNESVEIGLGGIFFEHESNAASMELLRSSGAPETLAIPINPFGATYGYADFVWKGVKDGSVQYSGTFTGIDIDLPASSAAQLDIKALSILRANETEQEIKKYWYKAQFDSQINNQQDLAYHLGSAGVSPPDIAGWTGSFTEKKDSWIVTRVFDLDYSGTYDLAVQYEDGKGEAIVDQFGQLILDGLNDIVSYDENMNGIFEMQVETGKTDEISTGGRDDFCVKKIGTTTEWRYDANEDGLWDYLRVDYDMKASKVMPVMAIQEWVPGHREGGTWVPGSWSEFTAWNFDGSRVTHGYDTYVDVDGSDGTFESITQNLDLWDDTPRPEFIDVDESPLTPEQYLEYNITKDHISADISENGLWTYETHKSITRAAVYNSYSGEYEVDETVQETCDIQARKTFVLLGVDGEHEIVADVIIIEDVDVLLDPRAGLPEKASIGHGGTVYFYDSNLDGQPELGFEFTANTYHDVSIAFYEGEDGELIHRPKAIGFFVDNGNGRCDVDQVSMIMGTGDKFYPTYWLYDKVNLEIIAGIAYRTAWDEFAQSYDAMWWVMQAMDIAVGIGIQVITSFIGAAIGSIIPVVGTAAGGYIGSLIGMAISQLMYFFWGRVETSISNFVDQMVRRRGEGAVESLRDPKEPDAGVSPYPYKIVDAVGYGDSILSSEVGTTFAMPVKLPTYRYEKVKWVKHSHSPPTDPHGSRQHPYEHYSLVQESTPDLGQDRDSIAWRHQVYDMFRGNGDGLYPLGVQVVPGDVGHFWSYPNIEVTDVNGKGLYKAGDIFTLRVKFGAPGLASGSLQPETDQEVVLDFGPSADVHYSSEVLHISGNSPSGEIDVTVAIPYTSAAIIDTNAMTVETRSVVLETEHQIYDKTGGNLGVLVPSVDMDGRFGYTLSKYPAFDAYRNSNTPILVPAAKTTTIALTPASLSTGTASDYIILHGSNGMTWGIWFEKGSTSKPTDMNTDNEIKVHVDPSDSSLAAAEALHTTLAADTTFTTMSGFSIVHACGTDPYITLVQESPAANAERKVSSIAGIEITTRQNPARLPSPKVLDGYATNGPRLYWFDGIDTAPAYQCDYEVTALCAAYNNAYQDVKSDTGSRMFWINVAVETVATIIQELAVRRIQCNIKIKGQPQAEWFILKTEEDWGKFLLEMGKEVFEEVVWEEGVSAVLTYMGMDPELANALGEFSDISGNPIVESITRFISTRQALQLMQRGLQVTESRVSTLERHITEDETRLSERTARAWNALDIMLDPYATCIGSSERAQKLSAITAKRLASEQQSLEIAKSARAGLKAGIDAIMTGTYAKREHTINSQAEQEWIAEAFPGMPMRNIHARSMIALVVKQALVGLYEIDEDITVKKAIEDPLFKRLFNVAQNCFIGIKFTDIIGAEYGWEEVQDLSVKELLETSGKIIIYDPLLDIGIVNPERVVYGIPRKVIDEKTLEVANQQRRGSLAEHNAWQDLTSFDDQCIVLLGMYHSLRYLSSDTIEVLKSLNMMNIKNRFTSNAKLETLLKLIDSLDVKSVSHTQQRLTSYTKDVFRLFFKRFELTSDVQTDNAIEQLQVKGDLRIRREGIAAIFASLLYSFDRMASETISYCNEELKTATSSKFIERVQALKDIAIKAREIFPTMINDFLKKRTSSVYPGETRPEFLGEKLEKFPNYLRFVQLITDSDVDVKKLKECIFKLISYMEVFGNENSLKVKIAEKAKTAREKLTIALRETFTSDIKILGSMVEAFFLRDTISQLFTKNTDLKEFGDLYDDVEKTYIHNQQVYITPKFRNDGSKQQKEHHLPDGMLFMKETFLKKLESAVWSNDQLWLKIKHAVDELGPFIIVDSKFFLEFDKIAKNLVEVEDTTKWLKDTLVRYVSDGAALDRRFKTIIIAIPGDFRTLPFEVKTMLQQTFHADPIGRQGNQLTWILRRDERIVYDLDRQRELNTMIYKAFIRGESVEDPSDPSRLFDPRKNTAAIWSRANSKTWNDFVEWLRKVDYDPINRPYGRYDLKPEGDLIKGYPDRTVIRMDDGRTNPNWLNAEDRSLIYKRGVNPAVNPDGHVQIGGSMSLYEIGENLLIDKDGNSLENPYALGDKRITLAQFLGDKEFRGVSTPWIQFVRSEHREFKLIFTTVSSNLKQHVTIQHAVGVEWATEYAGLLEDFSNEGTRALGNLRFYNSFDQLNEIIRYYDNTLMPREDAVSEFHSFDISLNDPEFPTYENHITEFPIRVVEHEYMIRYPPECRGQMQPELKSNINSGEVRLVFPDAGIVPGTAISALPAILNGKTFRFAAFTPQEIALAIERLESDGWLSRTFPGIKIDLKNKQITFPQSISSQEAGAGMGTEWLPSFLSGKTIKYDSGKSEAVRYFVNIAQSLRFIGSIIAEFRSLDQSVGAEAAATGRSFMEIFASKPFTLWHPNEFSCTGLLNPTWNENNKALNFVDLLMANRRIRHVSAPALHGYQLAFDVELSDVDWLPSRIKGDLDTRTGSVTNLKLWDSKTNSFKDLDDIVSLSSLISTLEKINRQVVNLGYKVVPGSLSLQQGVGSTKYNKLIFSVEYGDAQKIKLDFEIDLISGDLVAKSNGPIVNAQAGLQLSMTSSVRHFYSTMTDIRSILSKIFFAVEPGYVILNSNVFKITIATIPGSNKVKTTVTFEIQHSSGDRFTCEWLAGKKTLLAVERAILASGGEIAVDQENSPGLATEEDELYEELEALRLALHALPGAPNADWAVTPGARLIGAPGTHAPALERTMNYHPSVVVSGNPIKQDLNFHIFTILTGDNKGHVGIEQTDFVEESYTIHIIALKEAWSSMGELEAQITAFVSDVNLHGSFVDSLGQKRYTAALGTINLNENKITFKIVKGGFMYEGYFDISLKNRGFYVSHVTDLGTGTRTALKKLAFWETVADFVPNPF